MSVAEKCVPVWSYKIKQDSKRRLLKISLVKEVYALTQQLHWYLEKYSGCGQQEFQSNEH